MEIGFRQYCERTQSFADQRAEQGILIITLSGRILWSDERAADLCKQIRFVSEEPEGILPQVLIKIAREIAELLQLWNHPKDWESSNIKRVIKGREGHVFVVAIGLPGRGRP